MSVERKQLLDQAVMRTRMLSGVLCCYTLAQAGLYVSAAARAECPKLTNLLAGGATAQLFSAVLMMMIATCIKKRTCYWYQIVLGYFLIASKLILMVVIAVQGRPTDDRLGCSIDRLTLAVMIAATILEEGILVVLMLVLRRLRRSKALGFHNNAATPTGKKFV